MSIRRCPYCKAIIEEGAEFCSNCGTQLLFPEDEKIEEEIPGEKIVEDDKDEEEQPGLEEVDKDEVENGAYEQTPAGDMEISSEIRDIPPESSGEEGGDTPEKSIPEEDIDMDNLDDVDDDDEGDDEDEDGLGLEEAIDIDSASQDGEEDFQDVGTDEKAAGIDGDLPESDQQTPSESSIEEKEPEISEGKDDSAELEKREFDKFIDSIRKDRGESPEQSAAGESDESNKAHIAPETPPIGDDSLAPEESGEQERAGEDFFPPGIPEKENAADKPDRDSVEPKQEPESPSPPSSSMDFFKREGIQVSTDSLPPWASKIKKDLTPSSLSDEQDREDTPGEEEEGPDIQDNRAVEEPFQADERVNPSEDVPQKSLPFRQGRSLDNADLSIKRSFRLAAWLKSRMFDVLMMAVVWLITVLIASSVLNVGLFKLIGASSLLLGVFYVILLAGYFFLFFFFLGETLGDYVFNERKRPESRRPV